MMNMVAAENMVIRIKGAQKNTTFPAMA